MCSRGRVVRWRTWASLSDTIAWEKHCTSHNLGILYAYCPMVICATLMFHFAFILWLMVEFSLLYSFLSVIFSHSIPSWVFNIFFILTSMALLNYCVSPIPIPVFIPGPSSTHVSCLWISIISIEKPVLTDFFCVFNVIFLWLL